MLVSHALLAPCRAQQTLRLHCLQQCTILMPDQPCLPAQACTLAVTKGSRQAACTLRKQCPRPPISPVCRPQRHSADHNQEDASHFDSGSYPASARRSQSDVSQYKAYDRAARQEQGAENSPAMYSSAGSAERLAGSSKDGMSGSDQPKQRSASGLRETGSGASVEEEQAGADAQQTDQAKPQHHATSMTPADLANYGPFANAAPFGDSDDE